MNIPQQIARIQVTYRTRFCDGYKGAALMLRGESTVSMRCEVNGPPPLELPRTGFYKTPTVNIILGSRGFRDLFSTIGQRIAIRIRVPYRLTQILW